MVLVPVSGHAPQPLNVKLNSSDTVARVRQYRAVPPEIATGEIGRSLGFRPLILDYALPGVRDQHADDLDCAAAHPHGLALHRRKPVADKVCQQLGWEAALNQHIEGGPRATLRRRAFPGLGVARH